MLIRAPWESVASDATELRRFSARERHMAFWVALWTAAVVAELLVLRPALFNRETPVDGLEVVFACVGGSFAACGIVAWHRRPDSHTGALMTATGFAFFLPPLLGQLGTPFGATLAALLVDLWSVLFVALLVSLLTAGRLETRVDRLLVFGFVLPLLILGFVWLLFTEEMDNNLLLAFPDKGVADAIDSAQRAILLAACVATVLVLGARWRAASRPRRRALLPTLAGSFVLLIYSALLINDLVSGQRSEPLLWIASCSLVTVPLAFLAGQLRSRLAREEGERHGDQRAQGDPRQQLRAIPGDEIVDEQRRVDRQHERAGDRGQQRAPPAGAGTPPPACAEHEHGPDAGGDQNRSLGPVDRVRRSPCRGTPAGGCRRSPR